MNSIGLYVNILNKIQILAQLKDRQGVSARFLMHSHTFDKPVVYLIVI